MRRKIGFVIIGICSVLLLFAGYLILRKLYFYNHLVDTPNLVSKWEADPRPLQSEEAVRCQLEALDNEQQDGQISLKAAEFIVIPGLRGAWSIDPVTRKAAFGTNWVPQGLTQSKDDYYISVYDGDHQLNSMIFQIDKQSKKYQKSLILNSKAHVGGISYDENNQRLLYSDDSTKMAGFGYLSQEVIDKYQPDKDQKPITSEKLKWQIGIRTSALTIYKNQLIVAKYGFNSNERSIVSIPLTKEGMLPKLSDEGSPILAKAMKTGSQKQIATAFIKSLLENGSISSFNPGWNRMQGITLSSSGVMVVSQSNGRNPGKLLISNRIPDPSRWEKIDVTNPSIGPKTIMVPRGVEEVSIDGQEQHLAVIFESGAKKYRQGKSFLFPSQFMDRILVLPIQIE